MQRESPAPPTRRNALVFSGGGIKFATHVGLMAEMEGWLLDGGRWLDRFSVYVGTSAGALFAALYAAKYTTATLARLAPLFAEPALRTNLFDWNWQGGSAAFLRHDPSLALGGIRGYRIQTLLEALLRRGVPEHLNGMAGESSQRLVKEVADLWKNQRADAKKARDLAHYYSQQLTFADCPNLYLITVNAYTGQKTVFGYRPHAGDPKQEDRDEKDFDAHFPYINKPLEEELQAAAASAVREQATMRELQGKSAPLPMRYSLEFHRFANRLYIKHDPATYGQQFPLAIAARASLSIPGIFEPVRILRTPTENAAPAEDVFIDGGVADNISVSVARHPKLGNAETVLAIALGNLGYRLPNVHATGSVAALIINTTEYMGEALVDVRFGEHSRDDRSDPPLMVMDALTVASGGVNQTELIDELITEGRKIARYFWETTHRGEAYVPAANVSWSKVFPRESAIFLSDAARATQLPDLPAARDVRIGLADVLNLRLPLDRVEWRIVYLAIAVAALALAGILAAIVALVQRAFDRGAASAAAAAIEDVIFAIACFAVVALALRLAAWRTWRSQDWEE